MKLRLLFAPAIDAIIQKTIREEFTELTVITVAHRVPTVINSDMVIVVNLCYVLGKVVNLCRGLS